MDNKTKDIILSYIKMKCPLCNEEFKYKINLGFHLKRNHTEVEGESQINRLIRQ
jgi:hypothetical protein|tara:strand:+ start:7734 stop:7895 length:162 start_codon:yes stop_codon:yes gene_type:complete